MLLTADFLKAYTSEDLDNAIKSASRCLKRLNSLKLILNSSEDSDTAILQKREGVDLVLGDIQDEEAYKIFNLLYGIDWKPNPGFLPLDNEDAEIKLAPLIDIIEKIPPNIEIIPPWIVVKRYLYTETIEKEYLSLSTEVLEKRIHPGNKHFHKLLKFDDLHEKTLEKMQDPKISLRCPEIFSLYAMLLISKDTDIPFHEKFLEANYESASEQKEKKLDTKIEFNYENVDLDEKEKLLDHVRGLYLQYYKKIRINLEKEYKKSIVDLEDKRWNPLFEDVRKMGNQIVIISQRFGQSLFKLKTRNSLELLCYEIQDFLRENFNGQSEIPTLRKIEKEPKGPSLIKKILIGDGGENKGIDIIRQEYKRFLGRKDIQLQIEEAEKIRKDLTDYAYEESFYFKKNVRQKVNKFLEDNNKLFPKNKLNIYRNSAETIDFWITELNSHKRFAVLVDNNFHGLLEKGKLATFIHKHENPTNDDDGIGIKESKALIIISEFNDLIASDKTCLENNEKVFLTFVKGVSIYQIPFSNLEDDLKEIFSIPLLKGKK